MACEQHVNMERRLEMVESHERENIQLLTQLNTLVKMLVESNERQNCINEQQTITLTKISDTVTQQGILLTQLATQQSENLKDGSISFNTIIRMVIDKALPPIIYGGLAYLILQIVNK